MSRFQDTWAVLRGLQLVANAAVKHNGARLRQLWINSSVKEILDYDCNASKESLSKFRKNPNGELEKFQNILAETFQRTSVVIEGVKQLAVTTAMPVQTAANSADRKSNDRNPQNKLDGLDISSITLKELEQILSKHSKNREVSLRLKATKSTVIKDISPKSSHKNEEIKTNQTSLSKDESYAEEIMKMVVGKPEKDENVPSEPIKIPELSTIAKQRKVPSSRVGRMASFGTLFAGLGIGTLNELMKGAVGLGGARDVREALLSPANAQRIVDTLCKVRGAALKLGQILSIQDSSIISPELVKAFERVRQAADYMPDWQVEKVIVSELGPNWRNNFKSFDDKPFAAASIGQVHRATLPDGMEVAIKIQYPGVAKSIESDIDNLVGMLKVWDVFPRGFFIDNIVKVAKRELNWEVDYTREAEYTTKFGEMISPYPEYYAPKVIKILTTRSVLTTELVPGIPLDKCFDLKLEDRKFIAHSILQLCLLELFVLQCMQTDPNWSNFLYDSDSKRLMLIDFGSTRFYSRDFIKNYRKVMVAAVNDDRLKVLEYSREMGFLTGYETKQMEEAHVDAVMILGEIFRYPGEFDFGKQNTTKRIAQLVPKMVADRLCPPPEEIYSIHRKLSGVFLLCARLNVKMDCRAFYKNIVNRSEL